MIISRRDHKAGKNSNDSAKGDITNSHLARWPYAKVNGYIVLSFSGNDFGFSLIHVILVVYPEGYSAFSFGEYGGLAYAVLEVMR